MLVLDIARPLADPGLGIIQDDVADRVDELLRTIRDPKLRILSACRPGQVARTSETLGRSIFGYYVEQGLTAGAADANTDGNNILSVNELARYVADRVDHWARHVRDAQQAPVLYPDGAVDFALMGIDPTAKARAAGCARQGQG